MAQVGVFWYAGCKGYYHKVHTMNKITYWLRKVGMLRTATYRVRGDASKLNDIVATDGGMVQSQKDIDDMYRKQSTAKKSENDSSVK